MMELGSDIIVYFIANIDKYVKIFCPEFDTGRKIESPEVLYEISPMLINPKMCCFTLNYKETMHDERACISITK